MTDKVIPVPVSKSMRIPRWWETISDTIVGIPPYKRVNSHINTRDFKKDYNCVKEIHKGIMSTIGLADNSRYKVSFVTDDLELVELVPIAVFSNYVLFEITKDQVNSLSCFKHVKFLVKNSEFYVRISYEQIEQELEFPPGWASAYSFCSISAKSIYPKDNKKDTERRAKYVEENWKNVLKDVLKNMREFNNRQKYYQVVNIVGSEFPSLKDILIPNKHYFSEFLEN